MFFISKIRFADWFSVTEVAQDFFNIIIPNQQKFFPTKNLAGFFENALPKRFIIKDEHEQMCFIIESDSFESFRQKVDEKKIFKNWDDIELKTIY